MACVNALGTSYYVDYVGGSDDNVGTNPATAWQHCPGDPAATGTAGSTLLNPGDTVYFKGGVQYVLSVVNPNNLYPIAGISLNWNGTASQPIIYNGSNGWGAGLAILTDNYSSNNITAFSSANGISNLVFSGFEFGPIGGAATLPPDPGSAVPANPGVGISAACMTNVTVANCYFHDLGYWFEQQPMAVSSLSGDGIDIQDSAAVTVTNCEFTRMRAGIEAATTIGMTNLTIEYCLFHNDIVWNIDLPVMDANPAAPVYRDAIYIHHNTFRDYDVAYTNWTGYGSGPHFDGIIDRGSPSANSGGGPCYFTDGPNIDIYDNTFYDNTSNNAGSTACVFLTGSTSANVYNNLFVDTPEADGIVYLLMDGYNHSNVLVRVYNNTSYNAYQNIVTVYTGDGGGDNIEAYPYLTWAATELLDIQNNIAYDAFPSGGSVIQYLIESTNMEATSSLLINNNDLFHTNGYSNYMYWNPSPANVGSWLAFSDLQGYGWEKNGQTNDPQFVGLPYGSWSPNSISNNYHLLASSPCIGAGVNLSTLNLLGLDTDKDGNPRPSGMWDLGAYEYNTNYIAPPPGQPQPPPQGAPAPASVTLAFSNVVQICTTKNNIDHAAMSTTAVTTSKIRFVLVASNTGTANSLAFPVLIWLGQGSVFDSSIGPPPVMKRVKALKENKSVLIRLTRRFTGNQAGKFLYVTDTNDNVLASTQIPDPE